MIRIGHLSLTLPHDFKDRAGSICRHTGDALATYHGATELRADHLTGLRIRASKGATDAEIGHAIANAMLRRADGTGGGGDA